jgi:hypothetical protein
MTLRFKRSTARLTILSLATTFQLLAGKAYAQALEGEMAALALTLDKTYIKTVNTNPFFNNDFQMAFSDTTVSCPKYDCVIKVEVSSEFFLLRARETQVLFMRVLVDAMGNMVNPNSTVSVDDNPAARPRFGPNTRTFAWMVKGLSNGDHTVSVRFGSTVFTNSQAGNRTLTITVYTP